MRQAGALDAETKVVTEIEITPEMTEAGALAGWGEPSPPRICADIAERVYRAMEVKRREISLR